MTYNVLMGTLNPTRSLTHNKPYSDNDKTANINVQFTAACVNCHSQKATRRKQQKN